MKFLRTATIFAVALVCAPAHAQFIVQVNPVDGTSFSAALGSLNGQNRSPANLPSSDTMSDRLRQLVSLGYFPAAGQTLDGGPEALEAMLAAYLDVGTQPDMPLPEWMAELAARAALGEEPQVTGNIDDFIRDVFGAVNDKPTPPTPSTSGEVAQEFARHFAEAGQRRQQLMDQQSSEQADDLGRSQRESATRDQRDKMLADLIKRQEQAKYDPNRDSFANYPFSGVDPYTPTIGTDMVRSGEYRGFARGSDFTNNEISGSVALRFDLDNNALSGQFDFGSAGMLHVAGSVDADEVFMSLDGAHSSSFGGHELELNDARFDAVGFFGPRAEEIGGHWAVDNGPGTARGRFATKRITP